MKILVCTDGSAQSEKALREALNIAGGCSVDEVSIITVYEDRYNFPETTTDRIPLTRTDIERFSKINEQEKEEKQEALNKAARMFAEKNINVKTMLECGHPSETIARVAEEGNYDIIVIGNRGYGGLKKFFLGSVSNAVLQEAKRSVLVVK